MPGMDGLEATEAIYNERPVAVVLVSAHYDKNLIQRAQLNYVMAYLVKPVTEADLETSLAIASERFAQFQKVLDESRSLRQALQDRKVIERAKGIIMQAAQVSELEAFRRLQKMSWDRNLKMAEVASSIVTAAMAMNPSRTG
jgi:response regulator NasT